MGWKVVGFNQKNLNELPILATNPFRIIEDGGKIGVERYFMLKRRIIIPAEYDYIEEVYAVSKGIFFIVGIKKKFGVYNSDGNLIVPVKFSKIEFVRYDSNSESFISVKTFEGNVGLYNIEGKVIINPEYLNITFCKAFVFADKVGVADVYNYEGVKILSSTQYKFINYNGEIILHRTTTGKWKAYDKTGKSLQPGVEYEEFFMHDEFLSVKLNGHWKVLHTV